MDEDTSFDTTKRQTINPLVDEINKQVEPLLKDAMNELGYTLPLYVRLYNQIRFYEVYGKLKMGTSVASKDTLAEQFGVTVQQIEMAFNNLTNKYKLGKWVEHSEPVFRNVKRTWMSNARLSETSNNYYSVIPELLQRNSKTITVEYLPPKSPPLSESKKKISENKNLISKDIKLAQAFGNPELNNMFDYWKDTTGLPVSARTTANRRACHNLLKKFGDEKLKQLIDGVALAQTDQFAPRIADFTDLQSKLDKLLLWGKQRKQTVVRL